jgi:outer membrane biosynthesis protein TonB
MRRSSIVFSTLMHIAFFVLAYLGLPDWWESVELETAIPVQMVENITDVTSAPTEEAETPKEAEEPEVVEEPPPPAPPAPTPPPTPETVEEIPAPEPEAIPEPEPIPEERVEEEPEPEPEPEPEEVQLAEQPPQKPEPPEEMPELEEEEPEADAFESLLKDLENVAETQTAEVPPAESQSTPQPATTLSSDSLSISAKDAMRRKVESCWNFDAGAREAGELLVEIGIRLNPDGSIMHVEIRDNGRMASDSYYRSAAESAHRAVLRCAPYYDVLGGEPYDSWQSMTLRFDPAIANR